MNILGKYPKGHCYPIRINAKFKIHDQVIIGYDSYFVIAVEYQSGPTILLDRPLEHPTKWNKSIVFNYPENLL